MATDMEMKTAFRFGLLCSLFLVSFAALASAALYTCSDGTVYGYCSTVNPGKVCEGGILYAFDQAPERMEILKKDALVFANCKCPVGTKMDLLTYKCKSTACEVDGSSYNDGSCITTKKPKQCVEGFLVDKASVCGCPTNYDVNGEACKAKTGCIVNNPPCASDQDCNVTTNTCQKKKGCAYDNPTCSTSNGTDYECDTVLNQCVKKSGCLYDNPKCADTEKCVSNRCVPKEAPPAAVTPAAGADDGAAPAKGKLLCCPVIAVLLLILGAAFWKRG